MTDTKDPAEEALEEFLAQFSWEDSAPGHKEWQQKCDRKAFFAGIQWSRTHELEEAERTAFEAARETEMWFVNHETKTYSKEATGTSVETEILDKYETFEDYKKEGK